MAANLTWATCPPRDRGKAIGFECCFSFIHSANGGSRVKAARATPKEICMRGYWLVLGTDVIDQQAQQEYGRLWAPIAAKYGARVLRGPEAPSFVETRHDTSRILMVEFPTYADAKACYEDPDYTAARAFASKAARRDLAIIEAKFGA
jgi:uncharacterized protein (DUF1330 family)